MIIKIFLYLSLSAIECVNDDNKKKYTEQVVAKILLCYMQTEWGSKWAIASGESNARGVAILFNNKSIKVNQTYSDHEGRYVIANIECKNTKYTLCNIYAPNTDDVNFFTRVFKVVEKVAQDYVIIGGDFNLALDTKYDRLLSSHNNGKASEYIKMYMEEFNMFDVWRTRNGDKKEYTWFKRGHGKTSTQASRIDFFLISAGLMSKIENVNITSCSRTDHSLVTLEIRNQEVIRGPGSWKFNDSLLNKHDFCIGMLNHIKQVKLINNKRKSTRTKEWEYLKKQCKLYSQKATKNSQRDTISLLNNLHALRQELLNEETEKSKSDTQSEHDVITMVNGKIKEIETQQTEQTIFRSRSKWVKEGQKMTKYFYALEKRNYVNKTMFSVINSEGQVCTQQKEILREQVQFYQNLYTKDESVKFTLENKTGIKITEEQKETLEQEIQIDELYTALKSMRVGKVPGCDGLTVGFYLKFWQEIRDPLWEMYKEVMQTGRFGLSSRKGLITLIPKKDRDPRIINKNSYQNCVAPYLIMRFNLHVTFL